MFYYIRHAENGDMARILEIYDYARGFMAATGNPTQWPSSYPGADLLGEDMEKNRLYVLCDPESVRGVFMFEIGEDPTYQQIWDGNWHSEKEYGVIHRIAGDGSGGIFGACLSFCEERTSYLRMDTHADNSVMQHILEKHGFQRCGRIRTDNGSWRIAYDKIQDPSKNPFPQERRRF